MRGGFLRYEKVELRIKVENELEWWFALSLLRQGQYRQARQELERLLEHKQAQLEKRLGSKQVMKGLNITTGLTEPAEVSFDNKKSQLDIAATRRLLALASAYLGRFTEAFHQIELVSKSIAALLGESQSRGSNSGQGTDGEAKQMLEDSEKPASLNESSVHLQPAQPPMDVHILSCQNNLQFTESIVLMLWGDYGDALTKSNSALEGLVKQWGKNHFKSLEAASLNALLLAYNSNTGKAEQVCTKALEAMTKNLGSLHPLTLQAIDVMVYIFRVQGRFIEAVDTASSLCMEIEAPLSLGPDHPQAFRSKSQCAAANLSCGNYRTAERMLEDIIRQSSDILGHTHPDTLRYRSELAQAHCYSRKIELAEFLALDCIGKQRRILTMENGNQPSGQLSKIKISEVFNLRGLLQDLKDDKSLQMHPDLLSTLQVLAKAESKKPNPDLDLVKDIMETVLGRRVDKLGSLQASTLTSEFELAAVYRDKGDLQEARDTMERVSGARKKLLGVTHPDTLAARYELLVMTYTLGSAAHDSESEDILKLRRWKLGRHHPDTLQSLLLIFAIQLLEREYTKAHKTADEILSSLRHKSVRSERLVESLQMEERVALFYAGQEHFEPSVKIFRAMLQTIRDSAASADKSLNLDSHKLNAINKLGVIKEQAFNKFDGLLGEALGGFRTGNVEKGDEFLQLAYKLCEVIYSKDDKRAITARVNLAKTLWVSGIAERKTQALHMMSKVVTLGEGVLGKELFSDLGATNKQWAVEQSKDATSCRCILIV